MDDILFAKQPGEKIVIDLILKLSKKGKKIMPKEKTLNVDLTPLTKEQIIQVLNDMLENTEKEYDLQDVVDYLEATARLEETKKQIGSKPV
jgi:hypothetical protein